jgi:CBS domain-containing protein
MRVSDVMTQPVISVRGDDELANVIPLMIRNKISGFPVVDDCGTVIGIMSEGDLLRRVELGSVSHKDGFWTKLFTPTNGAERYRRVNGRHVRDVMTENAVTVESHDTLADAARLMQQFKTKRLPVLKDGELVGMITRADFVKALGTFLAPTYEDTIVSDDEITAKFRAELSHQNWAATCSVVATSVNGAVTLGGYALTEKQRRAIVVAAETITGVQSVVDQIEVYDSVPVIGM